ncbi:protein Wnt-7b isoform X1 [Diorhabda sublineata]|uniref:protein Wnt-7b isoform X1 n=1 Tax=Diorhabda sublineata TaxID=1163346 RepID=UPI0024E178BD|nr:protein Wnt-7b isoform X1 [Diorhabda sublineata]
MYLSQKNRIKGFALLVWIFSVWSVRVVLGVISVIDFGAEVVCTNSPGLIHRQRDMCRASPDAMVAVGDGIRMATNECKYQFRQHRWNCTGIESPSSFGHVVIVGSREAAFTYAISSAGVAYSVTAACARGNISACGCDPGPKPREPTPAGWKWGGCSVDINYGVRFARKFLDARELENDARSLMNLHNNKAGRKAVKMSLIVECKCHGVSGSCTMKTCWKTLPTFRQIGDLLMKKYYRARPVAANNQHGHGPRGIDFPRKARRQHLVLTKGKVPVKKMPKMSELVFLQMSPNYCERDLAAGSLGTVGRQCNRTSRGTDGCDLMCCGRGYNTHQYTKTYQCRCKFHWCCKVECDTCSERTEEYMCK